MNWIVEQNLVVILTAAVAFVSSWAIFRTKVENLEKRMDASEKIVNDNKLSIERREEAMRDIYRRLNTIDDLKIEATLAEIKTELNHIRALLEKNAR